MSGKDPRKDTDDDAEDVDRLLILLHARCGVDFRGYSRSFMARRVQNCMRAEDVPTVAAYAQRLVDDSDCLERFVSAVTVHVTTMFRDPDFYRVFRDKAIPRLERRTFIRVWHAGCSTGEEAYSLAMVLEEAGLLGRSRIYATDVSQRVLRQARDGVFPASAIREFTQNYVRAGGTGTFSDYYTASYGRAILKRQLRESVVFSRHNLAVDGAFQAFDAVLCRNVLIYFNEQLQDRTHRLLYDSLVPQGILGLGSRETVRSTPFSACYETIDEGAKLFLKTR